MMKVQLDVTSRILLLNLASRRHTQSRRLPHRSEALTTTNFSKRNDGVALGHPYGSRIPLRLSRLVFRPYQAWVVMELPPTDIDVQQLRRDVRCGVVVGEQLVDIIAKQQHVIQGLRRELQRVKGRLAQYEPEIRSAATKPPVET